MFHIQTLNRISPSGLAILDGKQFTVGDHMENPDGVLVRSADMKSYVFPPALRAIARAGVGVNNIPVDRCSECGIVVFNTPGANSNAVKELAVCALLLASRNIVGGAEWVREQAQAGADVVTAVEKGKKAFIGPEIDGKTLGVLGLGAVGIKVANIATKLGMTVYGYDPYLSVESALQLSRSVHRAMDLQAMFRECDYITLHMPLTDDTRGMINADAIEAMKEGVRLLNLARSELVVDDDIIPALESGKVASYITDFPNNKIALVKNVVAIPHLGASSPESEENCAVMAADQLRDYLENGNIQNAVNLPNVQMERSGMFRLGIIHRNVPNMLASIMAALSTQDINVENLRNHSKRNYAYTLVDVNSRVNEALVSSIEHIGGVLRVRVLSN
ncbi:MAG: 3-phosphoglycerate dehydrogenase family protein [Oscillospiraceae bacterium]|nr:3-phosphoglycerate dehydrogenase family protein [Oscillospiraceae bacterium]